MMTEIDKRNLDAYLQKCEIQWVADHVKHGDCIGWLAPYCDSITEIVRHLREIGFHVKRVVDDADMDWKWVVTTSGVIVYADGSGLVAKETVA